MEHSQNTNEAENGEAVSPRSMDRVRDFMSTLPEDDSWLKGDPFLLYQGFWQPSFFLRGNLLAQQRFKPKPGDIFLCSPPKSGTTWLKALAFGIVTRTRFDSSTSPLLSRGPQDCVPGFEAFGREQVFREPGSPLIATHLPYASFPLPVLLDPQFKIVYICREPKDAFVSMYHFTLKIHPENTKHLTLEKAFESFCRGVFGFGPLWDHILGYWIASLKQPEKVLFLTYEDLKKDAAFHTKKLAEFMGYPFSPEEEEQGVVQQILELSSFEKLSSLKVNKAGMVKTSVVQNAKNEFFFRKGAAGDWKNHLTPEMAQRVDKITEEKLGPFGLKFHTQ